MGKQGPCHHCGVTSTPLWRNGPPEKPVLCNACGSRWRTKGSLTNYVPLHAREVFDSDELKVPKIKSVPIKPKNEKLQKIQQGNHKLESECEMQYCDQNFHKIVEGDISNRSSSGSAISGSDSCLHFGTNDASDLTGSVQSNVCDSIAPSKKIFMTRPKLSVEKLTKDLYSILHEEQASNLSRSSEDDLLYESGTALGSFEIGYGGVLIKHPNSESVDEESEASSFPVDKSYIMNEGYSEMAQDSAKRVKISTEKLNILQDRVSSLSSADLNVIINFESFMKYLTHDEQQLLMKYLPSIDNVKPPESLKSMFTSPQFLETLSYFQQLLQEGTFDLSMSVADAEQHRTLNRLVSLNCTKFQWLDQYQKVKDAPSKKIKGGNGISSRQRLPGLSISASLKRHHDRQNQSYSEMKSTMRSPKRVCRSGCTNPPSRCFTRPNSSLITREAGDMGDFVDHEGACFSPRRIFASPPDRSSMQFIADSSEGDVLLDVPSGVSFPEAELLYDPWEQKTSQIGSPTMSGVEASVLPSSSFANK